MTDLILADPKKTMAQHQAALRHYAKRIVLQGEILSPQEENEGMQRMREYLAMGHSFDLTPKELVAVLYRGFFTIKRGCGCPGCRARALI